MINPNTVIKEFRVTEKVATQSANYNQYVFEVDPSATKGAIAEAIQKAFNVKVTRVNVINHKGKVKVSRTRSGKVGIKGAHKKAIVTLKDGDKIEMI